jgi:hypothetical protein
MDFLQQINPPGPQGGPGMGQMNRPGPGAGRGMGRGMGAAMAPDQGDNADELMLLMMLQKILGQVE